MKRAIVVSAGTAVGLAVVLGYHPAPRAASLTAAPGDAADVVGAPGTSTSTPSAAATTVVGTVVQTRYGPLQVEAVVEGGRITDVSVPTSPANDGRSMQINSVAVPLLVQQAIAAQSAQVDGVSGATYTTMAFEESLAAAIAKAGL